MIRMNRGEGNIYGRWGDWNYELDDSEEEEDDDSGEEEEGEEEDDDDDDDDDSEEEEEEYNDDEESGKNENQNFETHPLAYLNEEEYVGALLYAEKEWETASTLLIMSRSNDAVVREEDHDGNPQVNLTGEDHFHRLPRGLIINEILDKLLEPKWLLSCSLVSRDFARLTFQTHRICCKLPLSSLYIGKYLDPPGDVSHDLRPVFGLLYTYLGCFPLSKRTHFSAQLLHNFLPKFTCLRSLNIELDYISRGLRPGWPYMPKVIKWVSREKSAIFLLAKFHGFSLGGVDDLHLRRQHEQEFRFLRLYFHHCGRDAIGRYSLMNCFVPFWSKELKSLLVTDSRKHGKIILNSDELDKIRHSGELLNCPPRKGWEWRIQRIQLPSAGCFMKIASAFILKETNDDDYWIAQDAFQGEEESVYSEAVLHILRNMEGVPSKEGLLKVSLPKLRVHHEFTI